jgi:hypothetical protein
MQSAIKSYREHGGDAAKQISYRRQKKQKGSEAEGDGRGDTKPSQRSNESDQGEKMLSARSPQHQTIEGLSSAEFTLVSKGQVGVKHQS